MRAMLYYTGKHVHLHLGYNILYAYSTPTTYDTYILCD